MVKVNIEPNELKALDQLLDNASVKPINGYLLVTLRMKIQKEIQKEAKKQQAKK
jgi:hypothetical protein